MFRLYSLNWQVYPLRREFGHVEFFFSPLIFVLRYFVNSVMLGEILSF